MSDMIRGLPLGQQSAQSIYQAPPSSLQTVGALGMGAYGASKLFGSKEGGLMQSYAAGGVTSQQSVESILDKLSDQQLQQAKEAALNRRDVEQANMIDAEMAQRASVRGGLGGAFNQIPEEQQEEMMAGGGIVAFANRGAVVDTDNQSRITPENMQEIFDELEEDGNGDTKDNAFFKNEGRRIYSTLANEEASAPMTEAQRRANTKAYYQEVQDMAGPSPYAKQSERITGLENQQAKNLEQQKGLAALAAIPAMLEGNNAVRGIGGAGGAFAGMYGKAIQADRVEKLSLMSAKNNLEEAQYKTRVGMVGEARQLTAEARRDAQAAGAAKTAKLKALGTLAAAQERASRPVKGATPNFDIQNRELIAADLKATTPMKKGETPEQYEKRLNAMAAREIYGAKGTKDITSRGTVISDQTRDIVAGGAEAGAKADTVAAGLAKEQEAAVVNVKKSIPYLQAMKAKDSAAMQKLEDDARAGIVSGFEKSRQQVNPDAKPAASVAQPLPANPNDPNSYKDGVIYKTAKGNGKWNATTQKFTPVP